ncbi:nucleoside triphosphate pyrophosphohydrolase [Slackia exigua]|uniref:MazG family protein n=1 Tax=Slackia exigua (strain ATCC 700122 / DSM 15923 / CIP 105133 / JCM 11022 / KCTC 5966 / S-7) TaxID=649764 RepID=D0WH80_SLAES|nr:nucleoside triphosphate pyrophosphohydrolase [Slackia exigua]EEZ61044.1 MazG family protein [Slackia exigua ATCC 700122]STN99354.1 Nucleoside triphosphate pyrophosphohydrolase [Slackia exigua]
MTESHPHASIHPAFDTLVETIAALRDPETGCPWDSAQTHESIAANMVEEAYEAVDAIEAGDVDHMREELGDVLMQILLQSRMAEEEGSFSIDDVCKDLDDKLVRRHPHVFGGAHAGTAADVEAIWAQVKLSERAAARASDGLLDAVPKNLPALLQTQKISRKAAAVGFEWSNEQGVWDKVAEEVAEFKAAATPEEAALEFGDILFALVNVARWRGIDAESALRASNAKFRARWAHMEAEAGGSDALEGRDAAELEELWRSAKADESKAGKPRTDAQESDA